MTVFVLTHSKKGVHADTGEQVPYDKEKPKGIIEHPPFEPMVQSLKATRQSVGALVKIPFQLPSHYPIS